MYHGPNQYALRFEIQCFLWSVFKQNSEHGILHKFLRKEIMYKALTPHPPHPFFSFFLCRVSPESTLKETSSWVNPHPRFVVQSVGGHSYPSTMCSLVKANQWRAALTLVRCVALLKSISRGMLSSAKTISVADVQQGLGRKSPEDKHSCVCGCVDYVAEDNPPIKQH